MDEMSCPGCGAEMSARTVGRVTVHQCGGCSGIFLQRAELADLVEAENDYHRDSGPATQPMPRITADMTSPPPRAARTRSYIETLFAEA